MKINITKEQLIDILENEPVHRLLPGFWFFTVWDSDSLVEAERKDGGFGGCQRCAVGAVLARVLAPSTTVEELLHIARQYDDGGRTLDGQGMMEFAKSAAKEKPLHALSAYFEGYAKALTDGDEDMISRWSPHRNNTDSSLRDAIIAFAEEYLPETIEIDTDPKESA
jgi:hypothetical protein